MSADPRSSDSPPRRGQIIISDNIAENCGGHGVEAHLHPGWDAIVQRNRAFNVGGSGVHVETVVEIEDPPVSPPVAAAASRGRRMARFMSSVAKNAIGGALGSLMVGGG